MINAPIKVPDYGPFTAEQAGAADYSGGNRIQLIIHSGDWLRRIQPRGQQNRGQSRQHPGNAVNHRLVNPDVDAGQQCSFFIATDRIGVTAQFRPS